MNKYIGHDSQYYGVEEHILVGGKKDGMHILEVRNGKGMELTLSLDRCCDIARLSIKGMNMNYFSPCGYVSSKYYDKDGIGFLKSFTAGFLTTCGLNGVGSPCSDNGEDLPLHGTIANTPVDSYYVTENEKEFIVHAKIIDEVIFSHKLILEREIHISKIKNEFSIQDKITNRGDLDYPCMVLYHMNMGYPLLSENSLLYIPSSSVSARNEHAKKDIATWDKMLPPTDNFEEQCYFHKFDKNGLAAIFNPDIKLGLKISFNPEVLKYFTEWKMMGVRDYVLGLEPGNCHPDGRDKMRKEGTLTILKPNESVSYKVNISSLETLSKFNNLRNGK